MSKKKPVIALKAGRTSAGAKAASSHTGALAGDDKVYDDVLKAAGVIRAYALRDLLEYARGVPVLPTVIAEEKPRTSAGAFGRKFGHAPGRVSIVFAEPIFPPKNAKSERAINQFTDKVHAKMAGLLKDAYDEHSYKA